MKRKKIPVLGVIPFVEMLSNPTLKELLEDLGGELICGEKGLKNQSGKMVIGAMPPRDALDYFTPNCLLITPGNRDDLILAAMSTSTLEHDKTKAVSGIVLTCGIEPHPNILHLIKQTDIPIILVKHDTFTTASKIYGAVYKLRAEETAKVQECGRLVEQYVDIDRIMQAMK
jgi:BioD-like phosphotransacetylase family protein